MKLQRPTEKNKLEEFDSIYIMVSFLICLPEIDWDMSDLFWGIKYKFCV